MIGDDDHTGHERAFFAAKERFEAEEVERAKAREADVKALDDLLDRVAFKPEHYTQMLDAMNEGNQQKTLHAVRKKYPVLVARRRGQPPPLGERRKPRGLHPEPD